MIEITDTGHITSSLCLSMPGQHLAHHPNSASRDKTSKYWARNGTELSAPQSQTLAVILTYCGICIEETIAIVFV